MPAKRSKRGGARPGAGRIASPASLTAIIPQIRVTVAEREAIDAAAAREGRTLTDWTREAVMTAVARGSAR